LLGNVDPMNLMVLTCNEHSWSNTYQLNHFFGRQLQVTEKQYAIWLFNIAMENCPFIDGLPIKNGDFPWLC